MNETMDGETGAMSVVTTSAISPVFWSGAMNVTRKYDEEDDLEDVDDEADDEEEDQRSSRRGKRKKPTENDKQMAMFCHLGGILGGFILPLVLWLTQRDKSRYIDKHGKEAINFQISIAIGAVVGLFCTFGIGTIIVGVFGMVYCIQAGMAASRGEDFTYPFAIRFIK